MHQKRDLPYPRLEYMEKWTQRVIARAEGRDVLSSAIGVDSRDALLLELRETWRLIVEAELKRMFLVAYMRHRASPSFTLRQISEAAGISVSGLRNLDISSGLEVVDERLEELQNEPERLGKE